MKNLEETIQKFEQLRFQINAAKFGDYQTNRRLFNELKNLLIENGFDIDVITIDHHEDFFIQPKDYQTLYGNPNESFKDDQGKLAALCTKAIRDLGNELTAAKNTVTAQPQVKTVIKTETVYPPTSWKLIRNGLFWTVFGLVLSIFCTAFYYIGENSKDKENADLVMQNGEKNAEIKELNKELKRISLDVDNYQKEVRRLENLLKVSNEESAKSQTTEKVKK